MASIAALSCIPGHSERCWSVTWHPTAPLLASCSSDKSVRLTSLTLNCRPQPSTALPLSHTRTVRALQFSPNGVMLATASFDSTIGIWERLAEAGIEDDDVEPSSTATGNMTENWENVSGLEGHENEVKSVAWSSSGQLLATCGRDKSVWVWECTQPEGDAEFECVAVLMDHQQDVKQVVWHPERDMLASASYDDEIRIYQPDAATDDWTSTHVLKGHTSTVWSICFSSDGEYIASASEDTTLRIWRRSEVATEQLPDINRVFRIGAAEKERWTCVATVEGHFERAVYSLDWAKPTSDGSLGRIVAAGSEGKIVVFDVEKPKSDEPPTCSVLASLEDAHGYSDINCVKWCTSQPWLAPLPKSSDHEEEDQDEEVLRGDRRAKWEKALDGVFASAADDGLVKIWRVQS